jgi:hypothetical protein
MYVHRTAFHSRKVWRKELNEKEKTPNWTNAGQRGQSYPEMEITKNRKTIG